MTTEKVTSLDVAKKIGVSQSAVSRVFTPGASVSNAMQDKVLKAANELGYRPNMLARSLNTGKSRIIGLVVSYLDNQFYPNVLESLSSKLQESGYHILIFIASNSTKNLDQVLTEILDYQVDGIIMASVELSSVISKKIDATGIPVILLNRSLDNKRFSSVTSNNYLGGKQIANFLIKGGHRKISHIAGNEKASTQRDRETGFIDGLKENGVDLFSREIGNFALEEASLATRKMFSSIDFPDAVFVANDHMAFAVMDVLRMELGLKIPEDVSVIGYDDVKISSWPSYDLTTVRQPINNMVDRTISLLISQLEANNPAKQIEIDSELIVRSSAKLPIINFNKRS
jgi:DNA-binding LacI/PurR family transcriptional regulator